MAVPIEGDNPDEFTIRGVKFVNPKGRFREAKTGPEHVVILKNTQYLRYYADLLTWHTPTRAVELGVFQGGTAIALALMFPDLKLVSFDIAHPDAGVLGKIEALGLSDRVKIHYQVSQTDRETINRVVAEEFGGQDVQLVIDDASHDYALSRRSFEVLLPLLSPRAVYVLEDWAWAHWGGEYETRKLRNDPALTNLVLEWVMMIGTRNDVFARMEVQGGWVALFREAAARFPESPLRDLYKSRGTDLTLI